MCTCVSCTGKIEFLIFSSTSFETQNVKIRSFGIQADNHIHGDRHFTGDESWQWEESKDHKFLTQNPSNRGRKEIQN